jgi:hypothetical protein
MKLRASIFSDSALDSLIIIGTEFREILEMEAQRLAAAENEIVVTPKHIRAAVHRAIEKMREMSGEDSSDTRSDNTPRKTVSQDMDHLKHFGQQQRSSLNRRSAELEEVAERL